MKKKKKIQKLVGSQPCGAEILCQMAEEKTEEGEAKLDKRLVGGISEPGLAHRCSCAVSGK